MQFFPSNRFLDQKMLLEAFYDNTLDELIIVNPSQDAVNKVKDLFHFKHPTTFENLDDYLEIQ